MTEVLAILFATIGILALFVVLTIWARALSFDRYPVQRRALHGDAT